MNLKKPFKIIFYFVCISLFTCQKDKIQTPITAIKYGLSFGECYGYCKKEITINSSTITFTKSGWTSEFITKTCSNKIDNTQWINLTNKIDTLKFNHLPIIIGCPDCADGGAEWIEIIYAHSSHKITFEYLNEPRETNQYINYLRNYLGNLAQCN